MCGLLLSLVALFLVCSVLYLDDTLAQLSVAVLGCGLVVFVVVGTVAVDCMDASVLYRKTGGEDTSTRRSEIMRTH